MQVLKEKINERHCIKIRIKVLEEKISMHKCSGSQFKNPSSSLPCECNNWSKEIEGLKIILRWFENLPPRTIIEQPYTQTDPFCTS